MTLGSLYLEAQGCVPLLLENLLGMSWPGTSISFKDKVIGTSLTAQWLRLHAFCAGNMGLIPGQETRIPRAVWYSQNNNNNK